MWFTTWWRKNLEGLHGAGDTWASVGRWQSAKTAKYGRDIQKFGEEICSWWRVENQWEWSAGFHQGSLTADGGWALFSREWGPFNVTRNRRCAVKSLLHYPGASRMDWMRPRLKAESIIMRLSQKFMHKGMICKTERQHKDVRVSDLR